MKREGRQRGMVRTFPILSPNLIPTPEIISSNKLRSPPTAGLFTKVSQKPTNHSKFTGKCGRPKCTSCHIHPACKSKDKVKGTKKLRANDVVSNYKLIRWGVVDSGSGLKFSGVSATGILDLLGNNYYVDDYEDDDVLEETNDYETDEVEEIKDDVDDDVMSFCEVDLWEIMDEDWCMVEENLMMI